MIHYHWDFNFDPPQSWTSSPVIAQFAMTEEQLTSLMQFAQAR